jgi:hypothetical protein
VRIGSDEEFIEITELEKAPQHLPNAGDVRVCVHVKLKEFAGRYDSVWLEAPALKDFIAALGKLEHERNGSVVLESCSPNEFRLNIRSRDAQGHFVAEVSLSRYQYSGPTNWRTLVCGGFELDPSSLPSVLQAFKTL